MTRQMAYLSVIIGFGLLGLWSLMDGSNAETNAALPLPAQEAVSCAYDQYIGLSPSADIEAAIKNTGKKMVQVVGEFDPVTMDYSPDRVRLITDAKTGLIKSISCG